MTTGSMHTKRQFQIHSRRPSSGVTFLPKSVNKRLLLVPTTIILSLLLSAADAMADSSIRLPFDQSVSISDAVFHGVVISVDYRTSRRTYKNDGLPHAFVTYRLVDVLSGRFDSDTVTLRFVGGPDGMGGVISVGDVPMFNVGDEDVLFIQRNGQSGCPLSNCASGRFRLFEGGVYSADGVPLVTIEEGVPVFRGKAEPELLRRTIPTPAFDELIKNPKVSAMLA